MGWAASPGAGPRDGERVALGVGERGHSGQVCPQVTAARTGPTTQSSTVQTPHCGLWRTVCARGGAKGKAEGPGGLNSAGGGPRAGPGPRRRRPGRRPRIRRSRPYLFLCKYITCALIHVHSWSRGRVLQCEDPTETPRGRTDAHGPHASTRARRDAPVRTR